MDFSEKFFHWMFSKARESRERRFWNRNVFELTSGDSLSRLEFFAAAVCERPIRIFVSDGIEAPDSNAIVLPRRLALGAAGDDDLLFYRYRILMYHAALSLHKFSQASGPSLRDRLLEGLSVRGELESYLLARFSGFVEIQRQVENALSENVPRFVQFDSKFERWQQSSQRFWQRDWESNPYFPLHLVALLPTSYDTHSTFTAGDAMPVHARAKQGDNGMRTHLTSKKLKTVARPEVKQLDEKEENPLSHVFEKVLTAEEYRGGTKQQDGADELDAHADALAELTLDTMVRSAAETNSLLKSDVQAAIVPPAESETHPIAAARAIAYPEWFESKRRFAQDFCTVYESNLDVNPSQVVPAAVPLSGEIRAKLSQFLNESRWRNRQKEGPDFDIDALVRWETERHASGKAAISVDQRIYMGRRRRERDIAVLLLIDSSMSTDSWVKNRRTLDVMREAVDILGMALEGFDDRFGIATFFSHTRRRCDFRWVKDFGDSWTSSRARLYSVVPEGYTRIGPALRHAHEVLRETKARRKLLMIFSDAKPTDYDRYEGVHGLGDVAKAVREMRADGIFVRGIAVAQDQRADLVRMFGSGHYQVLEGADEIVEGAYKLFADAMR